MSKKSPWSDPPLHYAPLDHVSAPPLPHTKTTYKAPALRRAVIAAVVAALVLWPLSALL